MRGPLLLYALLHTFLTQLIEGDEVYTKIERNRPPEESEGWTVVLMDRASRFIWALSCGKKDRDLFLSAIQIVMDIIARTGDVTLITDGERRYGLLLFDSPFANQKRQKANFFEGVKKLAYYFKNHHLALRLLHS